MVRVTVAFMTGMAFCMGLLLGLLLQLPRVHSPVDPGGRESRSARPARLLLSAGRSKRQAPVPSTNGGGHRDAAYPREEEEEVKLQGTYRDISDVFDRNSDQEESSVSSSSSSSSSSSPSLGNGGAARRLGKAAGHVVAAASETRSKYNERQMDTRPGGKIHSPDINWKNDFNYTQGSPSAAVGVDSAQRVETEARRPAKIKSRPNNERQTEPRPAPSLRAAARKVTVNVKSTNPGQKAARSPTMEEGMLGAQRARVGGSGDSLHRQQHGAEVAREENGSEMTKMMMRRRRESEDDDQHIGSSVGAGVYWAAAQSGVVPEGFSDQQVEKWREKLANLKVVTIAEGCGRMQNRLVVFDDASKACARYRINTDQIQGEVFSYYLSRLLHIHHVPPSVLVLPEPRHPRWAAVAATSRGLASAHWHPERPVILTPWVDRLVPAYIPAELRHLAAAPTDSVHRGLHPSTSLLRNRTRETLSELVQWSDLIVFDYLTGNVDRVINNLHNQQWNSDAMSSPAHNLERAPDTGLLVFLDNESGLFHSYRLLDKYAHYHEALLKSLCIFREETADRIRTLHRSKNIGAELFELFQKHEPLHQYVARMSAKNARLLQQRLENVHRQIEHCEKVYGR